jgi:hypothetical protein
MNIESATLVLRTINGTTNATNTQSTWRVNLRQTLGNLYNKYDRFKICLTAWGTGSASGGFSNDDLTTILYLSGLNWENQTYDTAINGLQAKAVIGTVKFLNATSTIENFTGEVGQVFLKPNYDELDITLSIEKISGAAITLTYPATCYVFSIYGIPDEK